MDARFRFVVGFVTVLNALLVVVLCGLVMQARDDVKNLQTVLATKQDLVNVAAPRLTLFTEDRCTRCHSERRFLGPHNNERGKLVHALAEMQELPDTKFTDEDLAKIHGSLALLRCAQCHGVEQLRQLAIKSPAERMQIIREMIARPDSGASPDEAEEIARSLEHLIGF